MSVIDALLVVVRNDNYVSVLQDLGVLILPLSCTERVRGGGQSQFRTRIRILFSFADEDGRFICDCFFDFW